MQWMEYVLDYVMILEFIFMFLIEAMDLQLLVYVLLLIENFTKRLCKKFEFFDIL